MGFMCSATGGIIGNNRNARVMRRETSRIAYPDGDTELIKLEKRAQDKKDIAGVFYPGAFPKRSGNSTDTVFLPGTMMGG